MRKIVNNSLRRVMIIAVPALMAALAAFGQGTTSPYSMYGYGLLGDRATSMQRQMGGIGYAMHSGRQINVMNPASYASIDSLTFLFDMGADFTAVWSKEGADRESTVGGGLDYVTMQFPLSRHFGASIGLLPFSSVGYAFGGDISHGAREHQGSGGINMAYLGLAGNYFGLGFGLNISYNFGTIINDTYANTDNGSQSLYEHVLQVRDWDINFGLQYTANFSRFDRGVIGVTYSPKKSLHGKAWQTVQELTQETVPDTVGFTRLRGNYFTPNSFGVGLNYTHEKTSRIMAEVDLSYQLWSQARYSALPAVDEQGRPTDVPSEAVYPAINFFDRMKVAVGGEFVPKVRGSYMERVAYRVGGYFCNDYLNILGNRVREYGVSCGLGLRTPGDKTMINVGFEWKHRSTSPTVLISENYFNITLGLNFNELWFWQRKIK